jgi:hypothetical protein
MVRVGAGSMVVAAAVAGALLVALAPPALAVGETITLDSSRTVMVFGQNTDLSGVIDPPTPGEEIQIVDADAPATVLASATTNAEGAYTTKLDDDPDANVTVQAVWVSTGAASEAISLRVRPVVTSRLTRPRLFDKVRVHGSIDPPQPGDEVRVKLMRAGKVVAAKTVNTRNGGKNYKARFRVMDTGRYRGRARFDDEDHAPGLDLTRRRRAPLPPNQHMGKSGIYVRLLEQRLRALQYRTPSPDRNFDHRTADAVLAFHKVQHMSRVGSVSAASWRRLIDPIVPKPRNHNRPFHIEIDQTRQVLYVIRQGEIADIVHTSTGAGGATHDGVFYVHRKIAGYSPNNLYYPSYFDGQRAVHGWPEVPAYPASHGCSRVPYWTAIWLHNIMPLGTQVRVYHS